MGVRVRFASANVKQLLWQVRLAWHGGDKERIRRLTALVGLAQAWPVAELAAQLGVCEETIYAWLRAFLVDRWASLQRRASPGRPVVANRIISCKRDERFGRAFQRMSEVATTGVLVSCVVEIVQRWENRCAYTEAQIKPASLARRTSRGTARCAPTTPNRRPLPYAPSICA